MVGVTLGVGVLLDVAVGVNCSVTEGVGVRVFVGLFVGVKVLVGVGVGGIHTFKHNDPCGLMDTGPPDTFVGMFWLQTFRDP